MKKAKATNEPGEMRGEFRREDFGAMVRGKYAKAGREASNVVVIAPEVQAAFPSAQAVNDALRGLLELAGRAPPVLGRLGFLPPVAAELHLAMVLGRGNRARYFSRPASTRRAGRR